MGVGRDGRVIDLHVLTGREGGRRRGWERTQACLQQLAASSDPGPAATERGAEPARGTEGLRP